MADGTIDLRDHFDQVSIISLPSRPDRRRRVQRELEQLGTKLESPVSFFDAYRFAEAAGFPSIGARGCYLSHLAILQQAQLASVERLLVLEDDVVFSHNPVAETKKQLLELTTFNWSIAYLGHLVATPPNGQGWVNFAGPVQCLHAYAVQRSALPILISGLETILSRPPGDPKGGLMHVDGAITTIRQWHPELSTWLAIPAIAEQGGSESDIAAKRLMDKVPLVRSAVQSLRDIKMRLKKRKDEQR